MNFTNILLITGLVLTGLGAITNVLDIDTIDENIARILSNLEKIGIILLIIGGIGSVIMTHIEISNL